MSTNSIAQLVSAGLLLVAAFLLVNPLGVWMPDTLHMIVLGFAVAVFGALSIFILKEGQGDERENQHREAAGRVAFLAGSVILIVGIVAETLEHRLDQWLVWALLAMVLAKVLARLWSASYR